MKNKRFDFSSIRFRVWLYFLGFTAILLVLIWFLQIFFLNQYYEDMKIRRTQDAANQLVQLYQAGDETGFTTLANQITEDNDVFVRLDEGDKMIYPSIETLAYGNEIADARNGLQIAVSNGESVYTFTEVNELKQKRTYVFSTYLDETQTVSLYVITPLYPIRSTVSILQNQFLYIFAIALGLAILLAYWLTARITRPIRKITVTARKMAAGEYGTVAEVGKHSFSEIKELSDTLNQTSYELSKADALQKDVLANISHDLRTPLTMIRSYAEMIRDISGDNPEKRNAHVQVIIDEANRLNSLVNDMMILSQMQAGTMQINIGTFDILAATESVVNPYKLLEANGYDIQIHCRENYKVKGDEDKIKQVISNFLTNAIKYCGADKQILINIRRWGKKIHFEVVDHGAGIKPEELAHIWERYYKSSTNHVRATKGTGLGLSIVSEILTRHKARFGAESKVGKGTTFWFELPLAEESLGTVPRDTRPIQLDPEHQKRRIRKRGQ
ncbi:MAG: HAMP domain-containing histidine kinase [Clostridiales bacterium]|nr:HAMP domain-containing histidine kinase [Clostridiales bacterium]